jgi:23S rRNA (adenine1618-N6)-methyltransferase
VKMKVIPMEQGNKKSRIVAWTFLSEKQQKIWAQTRFS